DARPPRRPARWVGSSGPGERHPPRPADTTAQRCSTGSSLVKSRVHIDNVTPSVSCGRYAAKAVVGEDVVVGADILREGHELLAAVVRYRGPDDSDWREAPMRLDADDRWYGHFTVD